MFFSGAKIYAEDGVYAQGAVIVRGEKIVEILPQVTQTDLENFTDGNMQKFVAPSTWHFIPGMIDIHVHGAMGADVMDGSEKALQEIAQALPKEGVTAFLGTTMTSNAAHLNRVLQGFCSYRGQQLGGGGAELLGINLEGPFISAAKAGAQARECIQKPDVNMLRAWHEIIGDGLKVITLAPEIDGSRDLINYAVKHGIVAAVGHSDASFEKMCDAINLGCNHATHLFNAFPPLHHREPGGVLALLLDPRVTVEAIVDGVHLHPAIVQMILRLKGNDKVILITDAMRAKGLGNGDYELGGQKVRVMGGEARVIDATGESGALAGSVMKMNEAFRNMIKFTGCSVDDAVKMTSTNAAQKLGVWQRKGSIAVGKDADIILLNENFDVMLTLCRGKTATLDNFFMS